MSKFHDDFDYENAKMDIWENGGDPDYLSHFDPSERDSFMREMDLDPKDYGSKWEDPVTSSHSSFFDDFDTFNDFNSHESHNYFNNTNDFGNRYDDFRDSSSEPLWNYLTTAPLTEDYVDDYSPDNEKVCEDIQDVIDSGFYTKSQILRMYRGLDEKTLVTKFNIEKLIPEPESTPAPESSYTAEEYSYSFHEENNTGKAKTTETSRGMGCLIAIVIVLGVFYLVWMMLDFGGVTSCTQSSRFTYGYYNSTSQMYYGDE